MNYRQPIVTDGDIWEWVKGFEGVYKISNWGNVKSANRNIKHYRGGLSFRAGQVLSINLDKYGYPKVTLQKAGRRKYFTVHRLVATAFIPNPDNLPQINHKDGDKTNNFVDNLEWCTDEDNKKHAHTTGLIDYSKNSGENCYTTNLTNKIVLEIRNKMDSGVRNKDIEKEYNLGRSTVSRIKTRKSFKNI